MKMNNLILIVMAAVAIIGLGSLYALNSYNIKSHGEKNSFKGHGYSEGTYGPLALPENAKTKPFKKTD